VLHGCFLPSGFDNQKCAPQPRSEGSSRNYTMTLKPGYPVANDFALFTPRRRG
jgi:hypothetical protein